MGDSNWKEYRLGDIGRIVTGKTPPTAEPENYGGILPFITPSDMKGQKYIDVTERTISAIGVKYIKNLLVPPKTVFVSCIGSDMGKVGVTKVESVTNQQINSIIVNEGIESDYVYYNLCSRKDELQRLATSGSAQPILNKGHFSQLKITIPSPPEQKAIASILGALDDKIELNREMNETLEAMARAIFKSWFVDFDSIPGLGPHKEWQDSPLGKIPKGWRVETIGNVIELAYGKSLKEELRQPGKIPVYGSNGQVGWHNEKLVDGPGIVVGRKGNPGIVTWVSTDFYPIDTTFYVVPKGIIKSMHYILHALKLQDLPSLGADSAVPGLNRNMAYMNTMIVPPEDVIAFFDKQVKTLSEVVNHNNEESRTLASIRDTLLPKLLSGEIRVKDAERFVGESL
ncbi:MAG: restriction endonuclease subunit S [Nitrospirota bacterium]